MEKNIKDYLHLYLGCEVRIKDGGILYGDEKMTELNIYGYVHLYERGGYWPIDQIKPILRPLSDMSEEEMKECGNLVYDFSEDGELNKRSTRDFETLLAPEQFIWLLSKSFDLFGLIESGLAIDKTKNNKDNVQVSEK